MKNTAPSPLSLHPGEPSFVCTPPSPLAEFPRLSLIPLSEEYLPFLLDFHDGLRDLSVLAWHCWRRGCGRRQGWSRGCGRTQGFSQATFSRWLTSILCSLRSRACSDMWERMSPQTKDSVKQRLLELLQTETVPHIARKVRARARMCDARVPVSLSLRSGVSLHSWPSASGVPRRAT
jgi:hypothetical protein